MVRHLPDRLAYVIIARYGLAGDQPQTWKAIGQTLKVTRQRVQQLHDEALLWLAHPAQSLHLRQLVERNTVADYHAYLARLRNWQRANRRPR
jgi:DNA-directed RNA polymerase sigma subunit (sigma70/sigma32)